MFVRVMLVGPKGGEDSMPRIFGFVWRPPTGVMGKPNDIGKAELEKLGEGVSGCGDRQTNTPWKASGWPSTFANGDKLRGMPKVGIKLALFHFTLIGIEASAQAVGLETNAVA